MEHPIYATVYKKCVRSVDASLYVDCRQLASYQSGGASNNSEVIFEPHDLVCALNPSVCDYTVVIVLLEEPHSL